MEEPDGRTNSNFMFERTNDRIASNILTLLVHKSCTDVQYTDVSVSDIQNDFSNGPFALDRRQKKKTIDQRNPCLVIARPKEIAPHLQPSFSFGLTQSIIYTSEQSCP